MTAVQATKPRLLIVSRSVPLHPGSGGMERVAWDLAKKLSATFLVEVLTTTVRGRPATFTEDDVAVSTVGRTRPGRYSARWWRGSTNYVARMTARPDVVLSVSAGATAIAWMRRGPPCVFQAHGTAWSEAKSACRLRPAWWLVRAARSTAWALIDGATYRRAQSVIAVGPSVSAALRGRPYRIGSSKINILEIPNGVDAEAFASTAEERAAVRQRLGFATEAVVALSVSRLSTQKGVDVYVDAMSAASVHNPNLRLIIAGAGPQESALRQRVARLGLHETVHFFGSATPLEVRGLLAASDIFLFAPPGIAREGNPLAVLEAWASGLTIVTLPELTVPPELTHAVRLVEGAQVTEIAAVLADSTPAPYPRPGHLMPQQTLEHSAATYARHLLALVSARPAVGAATPPAVAADTLGGMPHPNLDIVVLATADWDATLWTNKQHTARSLRNSGHRILYVESMGLRTPRLGRGDAKRIGRRLKRVLERPTMVEHNIWRWSPPTIPWQRNRVVRCVNRTVTSSLLRLWSQRTFGHQADLVWTYNPMATALVRLPPADKIVYHCVDDIAAQPSMPAATIRRLEDDLVRRAGHVFVTSRTLEAKWSLLRPVTYLPNCVDADHFAPRGGPVVDPLEGIPRPRLGFVGAVSAFKIDVPMLTRLCVSNPSWQLVVVGPREDADTELTALLRRANVHVLGTKSYNDIPAIMRALDVGLIPARLTPYAQSMFPMKFFEYLAAGVPVVSTPLPALAEYSEVATLAPPDKFQRAIADVLSGRAPNADLRLRAARESSYAARTAKMLDQVGSARG